MSKKIVITGVVLSVFACVAVYADPGLGQNIVSDVSTNVSNTAVSQINAASQSMLTSVEQAPTKAVNQAMAANQAASDQAAASAIPQTGASVIQPAAPEILTNGSGGTVADDDPYTQYPEGMGNYNRNVHPAGEELTSQSELIADDSLHADEITQVAFNGIYLEVNGMLSHSNGNDDAIINDTQGEKNFNLNDNDFGMGLNFGYGRLFGGFYLGGELFGHYLPVDDIGYERTGTYYGVTGTATLAEVESSYDAGAALKLGWQVTHNVLLYLLLGADVTTFDITSENTPVYKSEKLSKTEFGVMPGLGLEAILFAGMYIDLRYTYNWYPKMNDDYVRPIDGATVKNEYEISRNNLWLGLGYHF